MRQFLVPAPRLAWFQLCVNVSMRYPLRSELTPKHFDSPNKLELPMQSTLTTFFAAAGLLLSGTLAQAVIVDLTTDGSSGTINGARYEQIDPQSTGTGVIDSFAQIGNNDPTAHAYNTTDNNTLDNGSSDNFNHSITLADVPIVTISGNPYRQFLLDINENNNAALDQFLSLDEVQIFVGGTANSNVDTFTAGILDHDGTLIYRMDAGGDGTLSDSIML